MNNFKTNYYGEYVKECWGKVEEETEENGAKVVPHLKEGELIVDR